MSEQLTASRLLERRMKNVGIPWQSQRADGFDDGIHMGHPDTAVTGIVTTFTPTFEVLKRAVATGKNTIICRETRFYSRGERAPLYFRNGPAPPKDLLDKDPTVRAKREFIDFHGLVIIKLVDNWDPRKTDGQLRGLALALGWGKYHLGRTGEKDSYGPGNAYFSLPRVSLGQLLRQVQTSLHVRSLRVIGDPQSPVSKVVVTQGFLLVAEVQRVFKEPGVDLLVGGEPVEWEASEYLEDLVAAKMAKGAILLGNEVSEEPGSGEMATWLKTFVTEVPVEWISAGEPFWTAS